MALALVDICTLIHAGAELVITGVAITTGFALMTV